MSRSSVGYIAQQNARLRNENAALRKNNRELRCALRSLRTLHYTGKRVLFGSLDHDGNSDDPGGGRDPARREPANRAPAARRPTA